MALGASGWCGKEVEGLQHIFQRVRMKTGATARVPGKTPGVTSETKWDAGRGERCGEGCHSFWRMELHAIWKETLRSWDTSCLRAHVSLVLLLTAWGIFHVLFQPVLESGYVLLVMYF